MALPKELVDFIAGLKLPADKAAALTAALDDEAISAPFKDGILAQSEFTRQLNELQRKEGELRTVYDQKAAEYERSLIQWRTDADKRYTESLDAERQSMAAQLQAVRSQMQRLATEYGVPEDAVDLPASPATKPAAAAAGAETKPPDLSGYLTKEAFDQAAEGYLLLPAVMDDIRFEHAQLFGTTSRPDWQKLYARVKKDGIKLRDAWESEYNVGTKRKEVEEADIQRRIDEKVKEAETRVRSELAVEHPGAIRRPDGPLSPALRVGAARAKDAPAPAAGEPMFKRATTVEHDAGLRSVAQSLMERTQEALAAEP